MYPLETGLKERLGCVLNWKVNFVSSNYNFLILKKNYKSLRSLRLLKLKKENWIK